MPEERASSRQERILELNLRGTTFEVPTSKISREPFSKLYRYARQLENGNAEQQSHMYFNRNPLLFNFILDFYESGELHMPSNLCGAQLKRELEFWGLEPHLIASCCALKYTEGEELNHVLDPRDKIREEPADHVTQPGTLEKEDESFRARLQRVMQAPVKSKLSYVYWTVTLGAVIGLLLTHSFRTDPTLRMARPGWNDTTDGSVAGRLHATMSPIWLNVIDTVLLVIITGDVIVRMALEQKKRLFFKNVVNSVEFFSAFVQWLPTILGVCAFVKSKELPQLTVRIYTFVLVVCNLVRVIPLVKVLRVNRALGALYLVIRSSVRELFMLLNLILLGAFIMGNLLYLTELPEKDGAIKSIPDAIWWGIITLTTVGYGDTVPSNYAGKIVGFFCAVWGIIAVATPVPIIVSNFVEVYRTIRVKSVLADLAKQRRTSIKRKSTLLANRAHAHINGRAEMVHYCTSTDDVSIPEIV